MIGLLKIIAYSAVSTCLIYGLLEVQTVVAQMELSDEEIRLLWDKHFANQVLEEKIKELETTLPLPVLCGDEEKTHFTKVEEIVTRRPGEKPEWSNQSGIDSMEYRTNVQKLINALKPENFFRCVYTSFDCPPNCDCQAYIAENCNNVIGGQTPRSRCIYRSNKYPLLYLDGAPDKRRFDEVILKEDDKTTWKYGFFVEAKGGCRCVKTATQRPEPTDTPTPQEPEPSSNGQIKPTLTPTPVLIE